jgi:hypothetical protein
MIRASDPSAGHRGFQEAMLAFIEKRKPVFKGR